MSNEIGYRLRQAREALGLTLEDVEASTRIQKKYLLALEQGDFSQFPSPAYVRSYIRTYAITVGENPQRLLQYYQPTQSSASARFMKQRTQQLPAVREQPTGQASAQAQRVQSNYQQRLSQTQSMRSEELSASSASVRQARVQPRRPQMPQDLPAPEELGIRSEPAEAPVRSRRGETPSTPMELKRDRNRKKKESTSTFGKIYTGFLIAGAVLLVIAVILFLWYRAENAANLKRSEGTVAAEPTQVEKVEKVENKPVLGEERLSVLSTSPTRPDRYELVNALNLELKIAWLKGSGSRFEIREQEIGDPLHQGEVTRDHKEFTQSYTTGIWIKLFEPNEISVSVNGFPIRTAEYSEEKNIYISFLK